MRDPCKQANKIQALPEKEGSLLQMLVASAQDWFNTSAQTTCQDRLAGLAAKPATPWENCTN